MKGKRKKRILGLVAGVLVATCGSSLLFEGLDAVEAATRLYGVQQVVDKISTDDPFVIMEVVPDNAMASFGTYVYGEEPTIDKKLLIGCNGQAARRQKVLEVYGSLIVEKDSNGTGIATPMYYDHSTMYQEQVTSPSNMIGWNVIEFEPTINTDGTVTYYSEERTGYYEAVPEGEVGDYTETATDTGTTTTTTITTTDENGNSVESTVEVPVYTYSYAYTPGKGGHKWVDSDTATESSYLVEFEKLYYKVTVTSNDWFVEDVLEYEVAAGDVSNIEVITITPSELELNISKGYLAAYDGIKIQGWNDIDMIYLSNSSCMNLTSADLALLSTYTDTETITETDEEGNVISTTTRYINDISAQTGYNIYEYVLNTNIPVIMDSSLVSGVTALNTNLQKLAFLLWDYEETTNPETYKNTTTNTTIDVSSWVTTWPTELSSILLANVAAKTSGTYGNVQGSVYVNNDSNIVGTDLSTVFSSVAFAELSSGTTYTEAEASLGGISAVVDEIDSENFYNEISNVAFTTEYNTTDNEIEISKSSVIKYILNYAYRRATVYKDTITVLDIEPTRYSKLTESEIRSWLKSADSERIKKINIVQTTTSEFIGTLSDLNAEYDLIYIGDCIGPAGQVGAMNQTSSGVTNYNDNDMDGLIYTHTGDTYAAPEKFKGLLNTEYNSSKTELTDDYLITRFSGNDITEEKMEELKEFVNSGYPVVVADKFYTTNDSNQTIVNSYYVDNSSWMYKFMNDTLTKENVMSDDLDDSALLATYINMSKLYLSMISSPLEYSVTYNSSGYIDTVQYLKANNGKYTLEYTFELADNSEAKLDTVAYEVRVYIDTNADGRYDATEELDGLVVRDLDTGNEVDYNKLVTGVRYTVSRELPQGYVGMIPWKLEVKQVLTSSSASANTMIPVHTSTTGYTAVPAEDVTNIKILQIKHQYKGYSASGLDLSTNGTFQELFKNVSDKMKYDIDITTVGAASYVSAYTKYLSDNNLSDNEAGYTAFYNSYFANYDMIMIGFEDMFGDIVSEGATMAIKLFIESGRSVLFSHDTTSFVNASEAVYKKTASDFWGYYLNQYIRSIVGMDRYGVTEESLSFLKNGTSLSMVDDNDDTSQSSKEILNAANKDIAFTPRSNQLMSSPEVHGYSNGNLVMQNLNTNYNEDVKYSSSNEASSRVSKISQVNKGQITTYPFDINIDDSANENVTQSNGYQMMNPDTMTVKDTHSQYYQLDLMLDKTGDGESDIVVWYCLADEMYDAVPNDVRNNYYIYSVGNIMYTGMGHSGSSVSLDEAKLFVNTMIASFNSGKKDPTIAIIKDADSKGVIKQYSYRTYDAEVGMIDTEDEVINFYVNDSNIISGTKTISLNYYTEVSETVYNAAIADENLKDFYMSTTDGGNTVYLRKIDASEIVSSQPTIASNAIGTLTLKADLFNTAFSDGTTGSFKIYISAQTTLDYDSTRPDETTGIVFTSITVKARDMFNLD